MYIWFFFGHVPGGTTHDQLSIVSIVGGLLLLVNMGPGGISVDEKKKDYVCSFLFSQP